MTVTAAPGWANLFTAAFRQSRNAMVLLDDHRQLIDANGAYLKLVGYGRKEVLGRPIWEIIVGGPRLNDEQWADMLRGAEQFTADVELRCADGTTVGVQWAATREIITGRFMLLGVALSTSRWGDRFRRHPDEPTKVTPLSPREFEVVRLVALGHTGREIADELHISHDTVRTHVRNAMAKTGCRSRAHLVAKALGNGHIL